MTNRSDELVAERQSKLETRCDAFLGGKIEVIQPVKKGHRSGLDAILLAAALPQEISGKLADLGSGCGVAGLAAIYNRPLLEVMLVENNSAMVELAQKSIGLTKNARLKKRASVLNADVTLTGQKREAAGLFPNQFDFVIMNPPYYEPQTARSSEDALKIEAHFMSGAGLDSWMRTAATILRPKGHLVMIHHTQSIGKIIAAAQGRFGALSILPVHSKSDQPAKRILIRATKASHAPIAIAPGLTVHEEDGKFTDQVEEILNGNGFLFQ